MLTRKNFLYLRKWDFIYTSGNVTYLYFRKKLSKLKKKKKKHFLSPSSKKWKKVLIFSQEKALLIFLGNRTPEKNSCILGNITFLCFRNWKLKNTSYISESNFPSSEKWKEPTRKKLFTFGKCNFLAPKKLTKTC